MATATTDANGHFTLAKVVSGGVLVVARRGGRVLGVVAIVLPKGGATRVDLTLAPTKRLNGRVTDAKGAPLAGAPVVVGSTFFDLPPVKTGADGRFEVAVPDLPLPWLAWAHGPHVTSPRVVVHRGGDNHLTGSSGRSVSGVVLEDGHPVAGAEVHVFPPYYGISTHTDAKGRFTLGGFSNTGSPGFALRASHGAAVGGVPFPKPSDTRPLVITLVAPGGLTVHVVDARGRPVGGAQVRVGKHAVSTGADGIATVAGVVQGAAMVQVDAEGHAEAVQQVTVRGAATDVTVRLSPGGDLVVQVRGLDPRDRASARVAVHRLGTWGRGDVPRQVPVDPKGVARVRSLRPGRYLVGLINLMQPKPVPVVVRFPRRRPLTLTVPPARPLAGRVVDGAATGSPASRWWPGGLPAACPRTTRRCCLATAPSPTPPATSRCAAWARDPRLSPAGRPIAPRVPAPSAGRSATWCCASAAAAPSPGWSATPTATPWPPPRSRRPASSTDATPSVPSATPGAPGSTRRAASPSPTSPPAATRWWRTRAGRPPRRCWSPPARRG